MRLRSGYSETILFVTVTEHPVLSLGLLVDYNWFGGKDISLCVLQTEVWNC